MSARETTMNNLWLPDRRLYYSCPVPGVIASASRSVATPTLSTFPTAYAATGSGTTHDIAFTMVSGNKIAVWAMMDPTTNITISSITWTAQGQSAQNFTQRATASNGSGPFTKSFHWTLDSPNLSGSPGTVLITTSALVQLGAIVYGLAGALAGAPVTNTANGASGMPSCSINPGGVPALIIDGWCNGAFGNRATPGAEQIEDDDSDVGTLYGKYASHKTSTDGTSTSMSWTVAVGGTTRWAQIVAAFKEG